MKKVLILEDNLPLLRKEGDLVRGLDYKCEVIECDNEGDATREALKGGVDLFIVDVILDSMRPGDVSGLTFAENVRKMEGYAFTPIIMVTGLEDPKLYSYECVHCYSFVEKPFDAESLKEKITQCLQFPGGKALPKLLKFRKDGIIHVVRESEVAYAEVANHRMTISKTNGEKLILPYYTIKELTGMLSAEGFVQCNRHCVVNLLCVATVDYANGILQLTRGLGSIEVGRAYKKKIKELFTE